MERSDNRVQRAGYGRFVAKEEILNDQMIEQAKRIFGGIPYTFMRANGFYPLVLQSDEEAEANGICNPGTISVTNELTGEVVFRSA